MTIVSSAMTTMHVTFVQYCQMLMQHAVPSGNRWFMCHTASVADTHVDRKTFIFRFLSVETRTFSLPRAQTHTVGGAVPRSLQHRLHYP